MRSEISAEIIANSLSPYGTRCTSFVLTMPRIVLAEFNTHRMISRNSASSRAIPFNTMVHRVQKDPFIPIKWMKDHKGMQGNEYFNEDEFIEGKRYLNAPALNTADWLHARDQAVKWACELNRNGVTK